MKIENLQESIKRYADGTMSATERTDFEQLLEQNSDLRENVRLYKALAFITKNRDLMAVSQTVESIINNQPLTPNFDTYQEYFPKPKLWWQQKRWLLSGLIGLTLLVFGIFYTFKTYQTTLKYQQIAAQYGHIQADLLHPNNPSVLYDAMQLYNNKNYTAAKTALQQHLAKQPDDDLAKLYLGITQYMTDENTEAVKTLHQIVKTDDPFLRKYALLGLALAQLKTGEQDEALLWLEEIKNDAVLGDTVRKILSDL